MKQHLLLSTVLFLLLNVTHAQFNDKGFEVTRPDLVTNTFAADTTANAIIIHEVGTSYVDENSFRLKTKIKRKIKILTKEGFEKANHEVVLYDNDKGRKESIDDVKATVYNMTDNQVETSKLTKSDVFEIPEGDHYMRVKFAFPNVKIGSVIVYSYTIESPFMYKYHGWNFQSDIPKLYSEYNASIPGNWEYHMKLVGGQKLTTNTSEIKKDCLVAGNGASAHCANYHYVMTNIPAFLDEDYMTTRRNYLARIEYELKTFTGFDGSVDHITKSWKDADSELKKDKNIGRQLAKSGFLKDILDDAILNEPNELERAKKVYQFVQRNYTWNDEYNIFNDVSVKDLIDERSGCVSEINILLHNLLEIANIKVKPILMSTRNNGLPTKLFPVMSEFNYLIVKAQIDGKNYMLDATDKLLPFGTLPFRCLNQYGRVLDFDKGSQWITIESVADNHLVYRSLLELKDDQLVGHIDVNSSGYNALMLTKKYIGSQSDYLEGFESKYPGIEFDSHELTDDLNSTETYKERFDVAFDVQSTGSTYYINPFLFKFFESNPLKLQERSYPIDFGYTDLFNYTVQLKFYEHYEMVEAPKNRTIALPNNSGLLNFMSTVQDNSVILVFKFDFRQAIYGPEFYESGLFSRSFISVSRVDVSPSMRLSSQDCPSYRDESVSR